MVVLRTPPHPNLNPRQVQRDEFTALCTAPPEEPAGSVPHLVLNFDVNQTVLMLDSAIKVHVWAMTI